MFTFAFVWFEKSIEKWKQLVYWMENSMNCFTIVQLRSICECSTFIGEMFNKTEFQMSVIHI